MTRATPFFFGPPAAPLFGWHHAAGSAGSRDTAIVLVPPIGFDYICCYRTLRILAERLAAVGFDVLRFDYPGTGNSSGRPDDPGQLTGWMEGIRRAVSEARTRTGAEAVALVGVRMGATLAASAAPTIDGITELVLWSPFRAGKVFVREATLLGRMTERAESSEPGPIEAAGFLLTHPTAIELAGLDLLVDRRPPASRVLLLERDDFGSDSRLADHLRRTGCCVAIDRLPGTTEMLAEPMISLVPERILDRIVTWFTDGPAPVHRNAPRRVGSDHASQACGAPDGVRERVLFFGPDQRLFGILTQPPEAQPARTAIIVLNTGCEHHVGPHRMYVPLAREWAALGHAVFRFDLGGIGDSRTPDGVQDYLAYPAHALGDIRAAITEVQSRCGASRVMLVGICSGGWHAFQAARNGFPVDGILAVNAPLYFREGSDYSRQELSDQRELRRYSHSLTNLDKWKKALRGRASVATFAWVSVVGFWRSIRSNLVAAGLRLRPAGLEADLQGIVARGIRACFAFSEADLTLGYFELRAKGSIRRSRGQIEWVVVDDADHTFRPLRAQAALRTLMGEYLAKWRDGTTGPHSPV